MPVTENDDWTLIVAANILEKRGYPGVASEVLWAMDWEPPSSSFVCPLADESF